MARAFPPHQYLRPAIVRILEVAGGGAVEDSEGTVSVPAVVRRQLRQRSLPSGALGPLRRAIEADERFRAVMASAFGAPGDDVDAVDVAEEISRLWLVRPNDWMTQVRWLVELDQLRAEVIRLGDAQRREERRRLAAEQRSQRRETEVERAAQWQRSRLERYDELEARVAELERIQKQLRADKRALERRLRQAAESERAAQERVEELERTTTGTQRAGTARRRAQLAPGGARKMSRTAFEHLLGSGAVVFIDGYNVAKLGWPSLELAEQRLLLIDLVESTAQRYRADITVVFDGAGVTGAATRRHRLVRVVFSSEGSTADDRIRAEVAGLDADRPVVVVTNDAEIVRDMRALGADVVSSDNFLACTRR